MRNKPSNKEKEIKILHIIQSINLYGGTPRKILWLARVSKYKHFIFYTGNKDKEINYTRSKRKIAENNIVFIDPYRKQLLIKQLLYINKYIKNENIDIIQGNFNYDYILCGLLKLLNPKIKFIATFVGSESPKSKWRNVFIDYFLKLSDYNIFISSYVRESKQNVYKTLFKKENRIIYNGALPVYGILKENSSYNSKIILTTTSGLNPYKNLSVLIDAIALVKNKFTDIFLNIVGDGSLRVELENRVNELGLTEHIKFWGYRNDIGFFLSNTNIYVHPADKEGFGIAVIEAMVAKLPVLLSNAGALPELIVNNESGLLANPYDHIDWAKKIIYLIENKSERIRLGFNAYNRVNEHFKMERYVFEYDEIYQNLNKSKLL